MTDESYVPIACAISASTRVAVLIAVNAQGLCHWIPRALIFGPDEKTIDRAPKHKPMTLRIFAWKAKELGLEPAQNPGAAGGDLFA